ncbi:MAG: glycoside hydrolase family 16 protein [Verrucomicrobia bacterium]|nr:glycoside hydrolase family 16 protein [Verrucomicrobiota bacterium]
MNQKLNSFLLAATVLSAGALLSCNTLATPPGYKLAWADEFDGTSLDDTKWGHRDLGKRRDALNVREAVTVSGGRLAITTYTQDGKHHTGMICTRDKFERSVGYWEARIQFQDSPGEWSAFWIHSPTMGRSIGDPAAAGMEIDVIEHRVCDQKGRDISGQGQLTLHWDGYGKDHKSKGQMTQDLGLGSGFHTYGLEWTEAEYRFYIDDKLTWTAPTPVSKRPEFIILSSEVKNKDWAGNIPEAGYGPRESSQTKMLVDYVRFYERVPAAK